MKFISFLFLLLSMNIVHEDYIIDLEYHTDEAGKILVAFYDSEKDFLRPKGAFTGFILEEGQREAKVRIPHHINNIAVAAYQDCNGNDVFDMNMIGIPKEPYALSNNCRAKWKEPTFEESKIDPSTVKKLTFKLEYWKNR